MTLPEGDRRQDMPQGRRLHDQGKRDKPRHWLAIQASRHPVGMALIVAVAIALIPLVMVLDQQGTLKTQANKIDRQQATLNDLVHRTQAARAATTRVFCDRINANGRANNRQTDVLQGIILNSVRSSKPFDKLYRQFGLPPYKVRLKQATLIAGQLGATTITILPCRAYVQRIENELRPKPPKPTVGHRNP